MRSGYFCVSPTGRILQVGKQDRLAQKAMLCFWWNFKEILHFEHVSNSAVNVTLYGEKIGSRLGGSCDSLSSLYQSKLCTSATYQSSGTHCCSHQSKYQRAAWVNWISSSSSTCWSRTCAIRPSPVPLNVSPPLRQDLIFFECCRKRVLSGIVLKSNKWDKVGWK